MSFPTGTTFQERGNVEKGKIHHLRRDQGQLTAFEISIPVYAHPAEEKMTVPVTIHSTGYNEPNTTGDSLYEITYPTLLTTSVSKIRAPHAVKQNGFGKSYVFTGSVDILPGDFHQSQTQETPFHPTVHTDTYRFPLLFKSRI